MDSELRDEFDAYLYMADVLTHLANHKPITEGDAAAWEICEAAQKRVWAIAQIEAQDDDSEVRRG